MVSIIHLHLVNSQFWLEKEKANILKRKYIGYYNKFIKYIFSKYEFKAYPDAYRTAFMEAFKVRWAEWPQPS